MEIVYWMMGSLADRSMTHVWLAAPFILAGMAALMTLGRGLDALTLGEDAAQSLGVNLRRLRWTLILGTAAAVGASVAVAGAVGFVGLVVPHLLRPLVGARPSRLLPAAALGGAAMLLAADTATRLIAPDRDLKLGVLTAIVGAPFFLHLIWKLRADRGMPCWRWKPDRPAGSECPVVDGVSLTVAGRVRRPDRPQRRRQDQPSARRAGPVAGGGHLVPGGDAPRRPRPRRGLPAAGPRHRLAGQRGNPGALGRSPHGDADPATPPITRALERMGLMRYRARSATALSGASRPAC
jgi:hypothetical protein